MEKGLVLPSFYENPPDVTLFMPIIKLNIQIADTIYLELGSSLLYANSNHT